MIVAVWGVCMFEKNEFDHFSEDTLIAFEEGHVLIDRSLVEGMAHHRREQLY